MPLSRARSYDLVMAITGVMVIVLDQLTKHWITTYFAAPSSVEAIPLLGEVLEFRYTPNRGAAFSMLEGQSALLLFIAVALVVIGFLYWRMRETGSLLIKLAFGLILGGAFGNLIDRFTHGYVVDFVHFQIPGVFNFAVFNLADSGITVGVLLLAALLWRGDTQQSDVSPTGEGHDGGATRASRESPGKSMPDSVTREVSGSASQVLP